MWVYDAPLTYQYCVNISHQFFRYLGQVAVRKEGIHVTGNAAALVGITLKPVTRKVEDLVFLPPPIYICVRKKDIDFAIAEYDEAVS